MGSLGDLARFDLDGDAVAQKVIDSLIVAVERAVVIIRLTAQDIQCAVDLSGGIAALGQPGGEQTFLDVAIAITICPITEVTVTQLITEEGDDAVLRGAFRFAYNHS